MNSHKLIVVILCSQLLLLSACASGSGNVDGGGESSVGALKVDAKELDTDEMSMDDLDFKAKYQDGFVLTGVVDDRGESALDFYWVGLNGTDGSRCDEDASFTFACTTVIADMPLDQVASLEPGDQIEMVCQLTDHPTHPFTCTWNGSDVRAGSAVATTESVGSETSPTPRTGEPVDVVSSGETVIHGTESFDLESGATGSSSETNMDVFWAQLNETERRLVAVNGSRLEVLGKVDFESVAPGDLFAVAFTKEQIEGGDEIDDLPVGTVVAIRTASSNYAKLLVEGRDVASQRPDGLGRNNMAIKWLTYPPTG